MMAISRADLLEWFVYEPDTGLFRWRKRPERGGKSCNVGDIAGSLQKQQNGVVRRVLWLRGQRTVAARAAWIYCHGEIGNALIDHINGRPLDDRISNLRLASAVQNTWNAAQREGTRFLKGVARDRRGRFKARVTGPDGKKINLGTWGTEAEAHAAYMGACAILHGEFALINRSAE